MARKYTSAIDEYGVDAHQLRVSGRVDIDESEGNRFLFDDQVLVVMLARVAPPTFTETKDGDIIRVNVTKPVEAHVVTDGKHRAKIMERLGFVNEAQIAMSFDGQEPEQGPAEGPVTLLDSQTPAVDDAWAWGLVREEVEGVEETADDSPIEDRFWIEGEPEPDPTDEEAPA